MKILIVGSGGREHALAWALHRDDPGSIFLAAPGNPGIARIATLLPVAADHIDGLVGAVEEHGIDLTIVGPEIPLALGLADRLRQRGRAVFGPGAAAARIEASKAWAKAVMGRAGIPTAESRTFTDLGEALAWTRSHAEPLVVKASGLAAGKGAIVCSTREEAAEALHAIMDRQALGEAGREVVIEEFMEGEELSVFALTNGRDFVLLPAAQDHKRLEEGDRGPNTGGMGAYSPVSMATPQLLDRVSDLVIAPALAQLEKEDARFNGLLYAGLMVDGAGNPRVVEFNCRFGDPETQAILPLLTPGLLECMERVARWEAPFDVPAGNLFAVTTVLAARGYPDRPEKGAAITLPEDPGRDVAIFHAGTRISGSELQVAGGRVLSVTGTGASFEAAQARSRAAAGQVSFDGKVFRRDIGWREAARAGAARG